MFKVRSNKRCGCMRCEIDLIIIINVFGSIVIPFNHQRETERRREEEEEGNNKLRRQRKKT